MTADNTPMTPDPRIAEIRKRLAAATPGPWFVWNYADKHLWTIALVEHEDDERGNQRVAGIWSNTDTQHTEAFKNAELIAHAPDDLAFLLSDRERAIDEAVMGERERAAKIADSFIGKGTGPSNRLFLTCTERIRRPTDTESGG